MSLKPRCHTAVRPLLAAAALVAIGAYVFAADRAAPRDPGRNPTRILLTWRGDPARSQAVSWRTAKALASPRAELARLAPESEIRVTASVAAKAERVTLPEAKEAWHYGAEFTRLEPGARYVYRVGDGTVWSEWLEFRTASTRPEPFRFLYFGDAQNDIHSRWSRAVRAAYAAAPDARLMVHAGDLHTDGFDDRLWGEWCDAMSFIGGTIPSLPVPGNHDLHRAADDKGGNPLHPPSHWRQHFQLPDNGPEGLRGQSYFLDYQGVRFVSLDVNVYAGKKKIEDQQQIADRQAEWLERTLKDNPGRWTVVFQHQPVYPIAKGRTAGEIERRLVPVFDRHGVDLVLQGHDHAYARSFPLRGGKPAAKNARGTVYVVSVSGPKMYQMTFARPELMAKSATDKQFFQVIGVDGDRLKYEAYTIDGALFDSFETVKAGR